MQRRKRGDSTNAATNQADLRRTLPSSGSLDATVARLRQIATASYDTLLLAEGPPHPDAKLLNICAEAAECRRVQLLAEDRWRQYPMPAFRDRDHAYAAVTDAMKAADRALTNALARARKLRATTPAGIYAKALAVRSSRAGAAMLSLSLVEDMLACQELRATLWPAGAEAAA